MNEDKKRTLEDIVTDIAKIMKKLDIDYAIVGGIAVVCWGNIRTTRDVDVIMDLKHEKIQEFVDVLCANGFSIDEYEIQEALKEKSHFTIFDTLSVYHIDAKGAYGAGEKQTIKTERKIDNNGVEILMASPEDTIINKLIFAREHDINDAIGIYVRQTGKLDEKYIEENAKKRGVYDELLKIKDKIKKYCDLIED